MKKSKSILYSSGNLAASLALSAFSTYIIFYYVDVLKMPAELIGLGMGISGIWNAINNPLFGQISDRTHSKWGRRIPYIKFFSLPLAIVFIFVWSPPVKLLHNSIPLMFAYFLIIVFLFDTLYTIVVLNWTSLFPEMYKTQEQRTKVSAYRQIFGIVGNIIGVALPPVLYAAFGWHAMGIFFGIVSAIALYTSLLGSKEDASLAAGKGLSTIDALKATFTNRSFLFYVFAAMFLQFTFATLQAGLPFYAKYVLRVEGFKVSLLLGLIFIVAMIFVGLWGHLANKRGSKKTIIVSTVVYGIGLIPFWFVHGYSGGIVAVCIIGAGLAGLMILLDVLLSDVIDEDEVKTGARREGMYYGINGFMVRLAASLQSIVMGFVLNLSRYNSKLSPAAQPASAGTGIRLLITFIPILSLVFSVILFSLYPLYGDKLVEVKNKLRSIHG